MLKKSIHFLVSKSLLLALLFATQTMFAPTASADTAGSGSCQQTFTKSGDGTVAVSQSNGYCYVAFKNTGAVNSQTTFTWTRSSNVSVADVLVIAGGGGGGGRHTGGGGAGGYVEATNYNISSATTISVIVGAGVSGSRH